MHEYKSDGGPGRQHVSWAKCFDRWYTSREVCMWSGLFAVAATLSALVWMEVGWVAMVWILGAFYFALVMGPLIRPTIVSAIFWAFIIFLGNVFWFRAYLTECRHQWKLRYFAQFDKSTDLLGDASSNLSITVGALKTEAREALHSIVEDHQRAMEEERRRSAALYNSTGTGTSPDHAHAPTMGPLEASRAAVAAAEAAQMAAKLEADEDEQESGEFLSNHDLQEFCAAHNDTLVQFYPLGEPTRLAKDIKHIFRATCPNWTCTYTQQSRSDTWYLRIMALGLVMLNVAHACFSCPTKLCSCMHHLNDAFGCGRFRTWWIWVWVYVAPMWTVTYVTFIKGFNFTDLYMLVPRILETAIEDTERSLLIIVIGLGFVLLWLSRNRIRQILGIDDRNIIHVDYARRRGFQVCVWSVVANQRDFPKAMDPWEQRTTSSLQCIPPLFHGAERNLLPGQGRPCNVFCRLAYGDNEPQTSRIVRMSEILRADTMVPFKESFCLELEDDPESDTLLHIEVRDQALVGAQELGRVTLRVTELLDELEQSRKKWMNVISDPQEGFDVVATMRMEEYHSMAREGTLPVVDFESAESSPLLRCCGGADSEPRNLALPEAETQILWMMRSEAPKSDQDQAAKDTKKALGKVGFKPHRLSKGGAVWLAFGWLDE